MNTRLKHNDKALMQTEKTDILALILKTLGRLSPPLVVGLAAKIANDRLEGRKLHWIGWTAIVCLSVSGIFISNWICEYYALAKTPTLIINAFATMFSEQIVKIIFHNSSRVLKKLLEGKFKFSINITEQEDKPENNNSSKTTESK